jgi:modulator of FtsH protease HflK
MTWDWDKLSEQKQRNTPSQPPDLGDLGEGFKRLKDIKWQFPGGVKAVLLGIVVLWAASGIYIVEPDEAGLVQRFGAFVRMTGPGPHYRLPFPVERVQTPKVTQIRRVEVGFRTVPSREGTALTQNLKLVPEESLMLTGDENIVDVQFIVQYQIGDPVDYVFKLAQQSETIKAAAEAAMREVIGYNTIDSALTTGKLEIQNDAKALLQTILSRYNSGMTILAVQLQDVHPPKDVVEAFKDVASAMEDKSRYINEAEAYANDILPRTRGQGAAMINDATGYKENVVRKARGEAARYLSVLSEYNKSKEITRQRLFLETMEEIFASPGTEKIILSDEALRQAVPYLPLDKLGSRTARPAEVKPEALNGAMQSVPTPSRPELRVPDAGQRGRP